MWGNESGYGQTDSQLVLPEMGRFRDILLCIGKRFCRAMSIFIEN